jgi:hypothetical protein
MTLWEIIKEHLREELALLKDIERYRSITTVRLIAICVLAVVGVAIQQVLAEKIAFDIGFVLAIFSIFISWLFFWAADRSSKQQMDHLTQFLRDFKSGSEKQIESLRSELSGAFKTGSALPPKLPEVEDVPAVPAAGAVAKPAVKSEEQFETFANAVASMMNEQSKQILIALGEAQRRIHEQMPINYAIEHGDVTMTEGFTSLSSMRKDLLKVGLIDFDPKDDSVGLSATGNAFVSWLIKKGGKAKFFESSQLGVSWGTPSPTFSQFLSRKRNLQ